MKFCINCGKKIENDTKFCPYCGAKQNNQDDVQPRTTNPRQGSQATFKGTMNNYNQRIYNYAQNNQDSFTGALASFFNNYANFAGRSTRPQFWYMVLWNIIFGFIGTLLCLTIIGIPFIIIFWIACIIPSFSLAARRLRDAGLGNVWIVILLLSDVFLCWLFLIPNIISIIISLMPSTRARSNPTQR